MALTIAKQGRTNVSGNRLTVVLKVTLDNSYPFGGGAPTNGYAFDANALSGIGNIETIAISGGQSPITGGYHYVYDRDNKRINVYESGHAALDGAAAVKDVAQSPMAQLPNTANDLLGLVIYITITGGRA